MTYQLTVPAAVPDVEEIRILEWHAQPEERIATGDLIVEFETHKAVIEVRAAQDGYLRRILAEPGDWRTIGLPVALFSEQLDDELPPDAGGDAPMLVEFAVT